MRLFVYDMLVNVNVIYYVHVCEQVRLARSAGNSAIENLCIIIIRICSPWSKPRTCKYVYVGPRAKPRTSIYIYVAHGQSKGIVNTYM